MPRTLPAGMAAALATQAFFSSIALLDIQIADGSQYFWTDNNYAQYPTRLTGATVAYDPRLKSVGPISLGRDFTTDGGELAIANLSGNIIDRDLSLAIKNHEFEGALAILRLWLPLFDASIYEFHGYLTEQNPGEEQVTFQLRQLADVAQFNVAEEVVSELCTWRFKSAQCGSTGSATVCLKRFKEDCQDPTRAAQERFNGVLNPPPTNAVVNVPPVVTVNPPGGGSSSGSNNDEPGRGRRPLMDLPF